jgi:hypothetical protein
VFTFPDQVAFTLIIQILELFQGIWELKFTDPFEFQRRRETIRGLLRRIRELLDTNQISPEFAGEIRNFVNKVHYIIEVLFVFAPDP